MPIAEVAEVRNQTRGWPCGGHWSCGDGVVILVVMGGALLVRGRKMAWMEGEMERAWRGGVEWVLAEIWGTGGLVRSWGWIMNACLL